MNAFGAGKMQKICLFNGSTLAVISLAKTDLFSWENNSDPFNFRKGSIQGKSNPISKQMRESLLDLLRYTRNFYILSTNWGVSERPFSPNNHLNTCTFWELQFSRMYSTFFVLVSQLSVYFLNKNEIQNYKLL